MKSQMSSAASTISLGDLPEEVHLAASPHDSASDSTIIYTLPGEKHLHSDSDINEPAIKRAKVLETENSESGSSTVFLEDQENEPNKPIIIGTVSQVSSMESKPPSMLTTPGCTIRPPQHQSSQKIPPQPEQHGQKRQTPPHVIKTSHKMNLINQKMLFQNPVCFMKWFERLEKFLVQASLGHHISPTKKIAPRPAPHTPTGPSLQTPGAGVPTTGANTQGAAQQQTIMLPVASASANGSITLLTPSTLPPASANISSSQFRQQALQPKKTVREMLDSDRAAAVSRTGKSPAQATAQATGAVPEGTKSAGVIDLTEEEEGSPGKVAVQVPQSIIMQPGVPTPNSANIRPGTYLLPMTSGQPILLQSIVNQSIVNPQLRGAPPCTTLVYTGPRPAGVGTSAAPGQSIVVSGTVASTATQQQLVTLPAGQTQIRQGSQLMVKAPQQQQAPAKSRQTNVTRGQKATATTTKTALQTTLTGTKHPAPLPSQPPQTVLKGTKEMPPKPSLKISRVPQGIVLSWNMVIGDVHAEISNYQLYAYQEGSTTPSSSLWKRVGEVKALPLPMACTLTQFQEGNKYHFAVRAVDAHSRVGPFSDPSSIHLEASTASTS